MARSGTATAIAAHVDPASLYERVNALFDRTVRLEMTLLGRRQSAFLACGKIGLAAAITLGLALTWQQQLSIATIAALSLTSVAALLGQTLLMKVFTGAEQLVYYRHEVAILAIAALTLWWLDEPIWPYLDITVLAVGAFLLCGRVGCLLVGCCHGRPSPCGPRYTRAHAAAGFTSHYVGIRLFPIQLVESAWVFLTVAIGVALVVRGSLPGEALAFYVITYDVGRFLFEFVRGDAERPYIAGLSEAQWTSLALMLIVITAEGYGLLPLHVWHWVATAAIAGAAVATLLTRRGQGLTRQRLLHPRHVRELATALVTTEPTSTEPQAVQVARTSLGIQVSCGVSEAGGRPVRHYTLSWIGGEIPPDGARTLADTIAMLQHVSTPVRVTWGAFGTCHVLIEGSASTASGNTAL